MKRNMLAKKLTATVLTGTMVMSMGGVTAYANGPSTAFDFTKYVTTDGNVHVPAVEFGFTATPADPAEGDSVYVVRGEDGGLSADSIDFASETTVSGDGKTISKKGQIHVKTSAFTEPGIYKYTLSENDFPVAGEGASDP